MDYIEIEKLLKEYKSNKSQSQWLDIRNRDKKLKISELELEIEGLNNSLALNKQRKNDEDLDEIEGIQLKAMVLTEIPRSNTNNFHSTTENAAMRSKQKDLTNLDIREMIKENISKINGLKYEIKFNEKKIDSLNLKIETVEKVIYTSLNEENLFVIKMKYEEGKTYEQISVLYQDKFKIFRNDRTIKNDRKEILNRLSELMKISE